MSKRIVGRDSESREAEQARALAHYSAQAVEAAKFELTPEGQALKLAADGWVGHPTNLFGQAGRIGRWATPFLPGVEVRHCGHPTALRPYHVSGVPALRGVCFYSLKQAKASAHAGRYVVLTDPQS